MKLISLKLLPIKDRCRKCKIFPKRLAIVCSNDLHNIATFRHLNVSYIKIKADTNRLVKYKKNFFYLTCIKKINSFFKHTIMSRSIQMKLLKMMIVLGACTFGSVIHILNALVY